MSKPGLSHNRDLQQVLFGEEILQVEGPFRRICLRQENIMDLYNHAFAQSRQNLQVEIDNFLPHLHHMAGVDKQDVVFFQLEEEIET